MRKKVWNAPKMTQLNVSETLAKPDGGKKQNKYESGRTCTTHKFGRLGSCS